MIFKFSYLTMDFVEDYFHARGGFDFFDALDYLEPLDGYDSDNYWFSGSEDYGSGSLNSYDSENEWMDSDFEVLGDQFMSWKIRQFDADNGSFPVSLEGSCDLPSEGKHFSALSNLMDLSAQVVSQRIPYSYIKRIHPQIPEKVAKKIMFWSFPRYEADIYRYWLNRLVTSNEALAQRCHVERIDQFGFCVQGQVTDFNQTHTASLICDRCVITTASCTCRKADPLWCKHIVALAICRIQHAHQIEIYLPIFDSVALLNRDQLQKLLQYLCCDGQLSTLKTLQNEVSRITLKQPLTEDIQDITAPAISERKPNWFLEPVDCKDTSFLLFMLLLRKALEMHKNGDTNGMCILRSLFHNIPSHACATVGIWDKIYIALISVISSPILSNEQKEEFCGIIKEQKSFYPADELGAAAFTDDSFSSLWRNNISYIACKRIKLSNAAEKARRSVFSIPLASVDLCWDDRNLLKILNSDLSLSDIDSQGLVWFEHFPTSCARIEVLFNNGYKAEAIRLAVVIAKSVILQVRKWRQSWIDVLHDGTLSQTKQKVQQLMNSAGESWLNQTMLLHKLDPVGVLFSYLKNASKVLKSISKDTLLIDENQYLQLCIEALIVILSQQLFSKNRSNEEMLREYHQNELYWLKSIFSIVSPKSASPGDETEIAEVLKPKIDATSIQTLLKLISDAGPFTVLGSAGDYFIPRYQWGYMMTKILYHIDRKLAEEVGWKCLKYPVSKVPSIYYEGQYKIDHIRLVVCALSLHDGNSKATDEILNKADYLKDPCTSAFFLKVFKQFIISSSGGFPQITVFTRNMIYKRLFKAFQTGKSNSKNTELSATSLLEFAASAGFDNVIEILENWNDLFDISSTIEILQECDWANNIYGLHDKNQAHLANVVYNIIQKCITAGTVENSLMFQALLEIQKKITFTEKQKKVLNDRTFSLGITLSTPADVLYTALSRLIDDSVKRAAFRNFVSEAIGRDRITLKTLICYSQKEQAVNLRSAYNLGLVAIQHLIIPPNCPYGGIQVTFEINSIVNVFRLAMDVGEGEVHEVISVVISNIKHDAVLCDVTKKIHCVAIEKNREKPEWLEKFITDVMGILQRSLVRRAKKLRNDGTFINTLKRTRDICLLANDGWSHFLSLTSYLKPMLPYSKRKHILRAVGVSVEF